MATKKKGPSKEEFVAGFKKASAELEKKANKVAEEVTAEVTAATKNPAETAEKAKQASKEAAEKVKTATKTAADKTKTATKKASTATKNATKKATAATNSASASFKKTVAKATAKVETVANTVKKSAVVQFQGDSYEIDKISENAIADYHANSKKPLKDIRVYIKPEDHKAYYVANGDFQGSVDL